MRLFAFALLALSLAAPAIASETPRDAITKAAKPVKICKPDRDSTGSRIPKRTCKTQAQWDSLEGVQELGQKSRGGSLEGRFNVERAGPGGR